jgi:hypothetical protein
VECASRGWRAGEGVSFGPHGRRRGGSAAVQKDESSEMTGRKRPLGHQQAASPRLPLIRAWHLIPAPDSGQLPRRSAEALDFARVGGILGGVCLEGVASWRRREFRASWAAERGVCRRPEGRVERDDGQETAARAPTGGLAEAPPHMCLAPDSGSTAGNRCLAPAPAQRQLPVRTCSSALTPRPCVGP